MFRFLWYIWNTGKTLGVGACPTTGSGRLRMSSSHQGERRSREFAAWAAGPGLGQPRSELLQPRRGAAVVPRGQLHHHLQPPWPKAILSWGRKMPPYLFLQDTRERERQAERDAVISVRTLHQAAVLI